MEPPSTSPPRHPGGVRTVLSCRLVWLRRRQTVCSGKCRAGRRLQEKARAQHVAGLRAAAVLLKAEADRIEACPACCVRRSLCCPAVRAPRSGAPNRGCATHAMPGRRGRHAVSVPAPADRSPQPPKGQYGSGRRKRGHRGLPCEGAHDVAGARAIDSGGSPVSVTIVRTAVSPLVTLNLLEALAAGDIVLGRQFVDGSCDGSSGQRPIRIWCWTTRPGRPST
jgi:hypothetical protein